MSEISEYQQVAAILAQDIDMCLEAAEEGDAFDQLQWLKDTKDRLIADKEWREMRYNAAQAIAWVFQQSAPDERTPQGDE